MNEDFLAVKSKIEQKYIFLIKFKSSELLKIQ